MKKYLIIILMFLLTYLATAQDGISFSLLQDVKLGLGMDKEHGNDTPTTDLIFNVNLEGMQLDCYYFAMQIQYEHANLSGGYLRRYSVHGIWNFNQLIVPKLTVSPAIGIGMIHRASAGTPSYSASLDISYPIVKDLGVIIKNEWIRRSDLITPKIGYNLSIGLKYKPIKL